MGSEEGGGNEVVRADNYHNTDRTGLVQRMNFQTVDREASGNRELL
jgi:hypothetical protein